MAAVSVLTVAFSTILITWKSGGMVEACSCQPMHPQDMFCGSDFVIKGRIKRERMVELNPDGSFKVLRHKRGKEYPGSSGEPEPGEGISGGGIERFDPFRENGGERPAPHFGINNVGPDLRMPGYISKPANVRRRLDVADPPGFSGPIGRAERRKRDSVVMPPISYHPLGVAGPPGIHEIVVTPQSKLMKQYRIKISTIFKGLQNFTKRQLKYLYTPPPPLCNAELPTNQSPYILMGNVHNGVAMLRLCDYKVDLMKLSQDQKKNVIRNMEHRYPTNCNQCRVEVCNFGACEGQRSPTQCRWKEWWSAQGPYSSQFVCIKGKKSGKCKWYHPLSKETKPEDVDEWTR